MDGQAGGPLDLEKELSCSICTDVFYQPLTLLDCLHTFCGSCLKEWFAWQAGSATKEHPYTCPACRAAVRGTRPNATVTTLLDIFLRAHPEKEKTQEDKFHIGRTYYAGEDVIPHVNINRYAEDSEDERLLEHARDLSLASDPSPAHGRAPSGPGDRHHGRHGVSIASAEPRRLDHQSSLRSLLSASEPDNTKLQEEIMQQIVDEGLLDNVDLNNLTSAQEEDITESIARAFRRRQAARPRSDHRTGATSRSPLTQPSPATQPRSEAPGQRAHRRRASSQTRQGTNIPASPASSGEALAPGLYARTADRYFTGPAPVSHVAAVARYDGLASYIDPPTRAEAPPLSNRSTASSSSRTSSLTVHSTPDLTYEAVGLQSSPAQHSSVRGPSHTALSARKDSVAVSVNSVGALSSAKARRQSSSRDPKSMSSLSATYIPYSVTTTTPALQSVSCSRCEQPYIEQEVYYNCLKCASGTFNLCLPCYRTGKGCLHWFGFGHAAYSKYSTLLRQGTLVDHSAPHLLTARRYLSSAGLSAQQGLFCEGCFAFADECYWHCQVCNDGAWGFCNDCVQTAKHCTHPLQCIGKTLAKVVQPPDHSVNDSIYPPPLHTPKWSHRSAEQPLIRKMSSTSLPHIIDPSQYVAMNLNVFCDICEHSIAPSHSRYHCPVCNDGNYDICSTCYRAAAVSGRMKQEDGPQGWRRCPRGHRMNIIGFEDREGGPTRVVVEDIVGGWALKDDGFSSRESHVGLSPAGQWRWKEKDGTLASQRSNIKKTALDSVAAEISTGLRAQARWSRFPEAEATDELAFPRNAIITEVEDINGDWYWGVYAGRTGLFPGNFVRLL